MCDATATHSTVVGPLSQLIQVIEIWRWLHTVHRFELGEPVLTTLERIGHHWGGDAPALLTVTHDHAPGHLVANELTIELAVERGVDVMCEPSYAIGLAGGREPWRREPPPDWRVAWDEAALSRVAESLVTAEDVGTRRRVAVIDSGADGSFMLDMVTDAPNVTDAGTSSGTERRSPR